MADLNEAGDRVIYAAQLYFQKKAPIIINTVAKKRG
jgi:hypothetical protein